MAPVMIALRERVARLSPRLISTGQHDQMLEDGLSAFDLVPDARLDVMRRGQSLSALTSRLIDCLDAEFTDRAPDLVLVQGDTTTTFAASLVAHYHRIPLGHVEAGLRTGDKWNPFPEETNRRVTTIIADLHFAPTSRAHSKLRDEGVEPSRIYLTGNTVIDALHLAARQHPLGGPRRQELDSWLDPARKLILVTAHRRENFGRGLADICDAVRRIAVANCERVQILFPVHLNPQVQRPVYEELGNIPNVKLVPPASYLDFVRLLRQCYMVLTDSGGVQEEAAAFGKPVLVMRETTERPEGIEAGVARLVGTEPAEVVGAVQELLDIEAYYRAMAFAVSPYGDGRAGARIVSIVEGELWR